MSFHFSEISFEWHSISSDIPFWVTFHFGRHSKSSDNPFSVTFHFQWHSILNDIPFWVTFHILEWHSIYFEWHLYWATFHIERYSLLSAIPLWVTFHFEWLAGVSISMMRTKVVLDYKFPICVSVSEWAISRSRDAGASKNMFIWYQLKLLLVMFSIRMYKCRKISLNTNILSH